eukprot:6884729-Prymnesium_polylepis.1
MDAGLTPRLERLDMSAPFVRGEVGRAKVHVMLDCWSKAVCTDRGVVHVDRAVQPVTLKLRARYPRAKLYGAIGEGAYGLPDHGGVAALVTALHKAPALARLDLSRNPCVGECRGGKEQPVDVLARGLNSGAGRALSELCLAGCGITDVHLLVEWMRSAASPKLARLTLSANEIGENGAQQLAGVLHCVPRLELLALDCNRLGPMGGHALVTALQGRPHSGLTSLHLCRNGLGSGAAAALVAALHMGKLPLCTELTLGWNLLGAARPDVLLVALRLLLGGAAAGRSGQPLRAWSAFAPRPPCC